MKTLKMFSRTGKLFVYDSRLEKKCEIHTTKFAIAPLNPYYFHTISILRKYTIINQVIP